MNKKTLEKNKTVIMSDKYLSESGVQGGKIVGEHLALGSFIIGIPFLIIGLITLFSIIFDFFNTNTAVIIAALLVTAIGLLLIIGGYFIYRDKHVKN
jgi:hypothetical protein